jgi:hypothetical protein
MKTGLTHFLLKVTEATREQLARANPGKLAAKYEIRVDHARAYIQFELERK